MSYKQGHTYDNINNFCQKYGCKLISGENEIENKSFFAILSKCGHTIQSTFNSLLKKKIGIYCEDCVEDILSNKKQVNCFKCNTCIISVNDSFLYCSTKCSQSRTMTNEKKEKIKIGVIKHNKEHGKICGKRKYTNEQEYNIEETSNKNNTDNIDKKQKLFKPLTYEYVKKTFENKDCQLITTEQEFLEMRQIKKLREIPFKIISSCSHETDSLYYGFTENNTGVICKKCSKNKQLKMQKENSKTSDGYVKSLSTQKIATDIITEMCGNDFIVKRTHNCCTSTILVKQKTLENENDSWLKIKVKSTMRTSESSGFKIGKIYDDVVVMMVCIITKNIWVFLPEELEIKTYYIGKDRTGHINNNIHDKNFKNKLIELINLKNFNSTFDDANTPLTNAMKVEYKFTKKRQDIIKFLNFEDSDVGASVYNFKINDLKIQEAVVSFRPIRQTLIAGMNKHDGSHKNQPYKIGDNDFYWFNINTSEEIFYVVPEYEFVHMGYISSNDQEGKKYFNITKNNYWLNKYLFNYTTINNKDEIERLLKLLNK